MQLIDAIAQRKSIRGFKPDPVSKETLQKVLEAAVKAPSAMNTQPWELFVVAGDVLDKIREGNVEALTSGTPPKPEMAFQEKFQNEYKQRQVALAVQLFKLMGIAREDGEAKFSWMQRGFRFFDSPAAIIVTYDAILEPALLSYFDLGCLTQTLCLAALEYDLGTCIHSQGVMYPQITRQYVDIPESKKIFIAISIGYPDWDFPANQVESDREPVDNVAKWFGV